MKSIISLALLLVVLPSFGATAVDKVRTMKSTHPEYMNALIELQSTFVKEKKWEHVLGIAYVYRTRIMKAQKTFRVEPFLMEAYSLIQFCRYQDARSVLENGKYYAEKLGSEEDLRKLQKAGELEKLSQLYKNLEPAESDERSFSSNELQWEVATQTDEVLQVLNKVIIRTESLCQ